MYPEQNPAHIDILSHTEQCVVCGDAADGFHYGVRSCRGCNAFFRRAVTFNMTYQCRRGGQCPVDRNARCACRACRLAKCYAVGMDKKAVQPKRDVGGAANGHNQYDHADELYMRLHGASPMYEAEMTSPGSAFTPLTNCLSQEYLPALPTTPPPESSLIMKQCFDFVEQKRRRRSLLCKSLEEILAEELILRGHAKSEDFTDIFQTQMILMFEWIEKLPEFRMLRDPNDKTKLLRAFALKYMLLDNVYHTYELGYTDRLILVNNNFIVPGYQSDIEFTEVVNERDFRELMFGPKMQRLINELVVPLSHQNLLYGEIMTLRRLMFWNPGNIALSEHATSIATEASSGCMKELQSYLVQEGVDNVDSRMEFILLILPCFTTHTKTMYELVRLIPSFGKMNEWNSFMDDVFNGV